MNLALVVGALLVALAVVEVGLRVLGAAPVLRSDWMLDNESIVPDRDVIMIPRRLLGSDLDAATNGDSVIVALGDSFTAGYPVDRKRHAYPVVLEQALARRGVRSRVINAGMGDSGPDQHLRLLETRVLPRLTPAVVIWSLYGNDLWDNADKAVYAIEDERLKPLNGAWSWIYVRHRLYDSLPLPRRLKQRSRTVRLILKATENLSWLRLPDAYRRDPSAWGIEKLRYEIAAMNTLAAVRGFRVYYLLIPPQSLYLAAREPERWRGHWSMDTHRTLSALLRDQATLIDVHIEAPLDVEAFTDATRDGNKLGERHFNERGYALLAETVAERLQSDIGLWNPGGKRIGS